MRKNGSDGRLVEGLYGRVILLVMAVVVVFDQFTKVLVEQIFLIGEQFPVIPGFFNLTLTYNKGVAFGLFSGLAPELRLVTLVFAIGLALMVIAYLLLREYRRDLVGQVLLAMIAGGAIGNIIDRMRIGSVVDFIDIYYKSYHWPAFNIADSVICLGVIFLLFRKPPV